MEKIGCFKEKFDITLTCASGVEKVVKSELKRLGYDVVPALNGTLTFSGDMLAVASVICSTSVNVVLTSGGKFDKIILQKFSF